MSAVVIVFVICAVACAAGHTGILRSIVRQESGSAARAGTVGIPRPRLAVELTWAAIPLFALALVLTATWVRVRDHARGPGATPPPPEVLMEVAR